MLRKGFKKSYFLRGLEPLILGGSWVVISRVISRIIILITQVGRLMTLLITTHEPPSSPKFLHNFFCWVLKLSSPVLCGVSCICMAIGVYPAGGTCLYREA